MSTLSSSAGIAASGSSRSPMMPVIARIRRFKQETADTCTFTLDLPAQSPGMGAFRPGQFNMLYTFGVGEVPISTTATRPTGTIVHTIRAMKPVTRRWPSCASDSSGYGARSAAWPDEAAAAMSPSSPAASASPRCGRQSITSSRRADYGHVVLLYGAASRRSALRRGAGNLGPATAMCKCWSPSIGADKSWPAISGWSSLFPAARFDAKTACGMICGLKS